ncbi:DUF397 domain-containing protein [Actinomadura rubrisoli]|nr:DUF397 domain-containing protein [Actinomadura rubrisoli]
MRSASSSTTTSPAWRNACGSSDGCVEIARFTPEVVGARDGRGDESPILLFSTDTWQSILRQIKSEALDLP